MDDRAAALGGRQVLAVRPDIGRRPDAELGPGPRSRERIDLGLGGLALQAGEFSAIVGVFLSLAEKIAPPTSGIEGEIKDRPAQRDQRIGKMGADRRGPV
jgi:hypothetical protein